MRKSLGPFETILMIVIAFVTYTISQRTWRRRPLYRIVRHCRMLAMLQSHNAPHFK
jgi:hypothetical protein